MTRVLIAVQARSTSTRLPNKIGAPIRRKTVLQHVLDSCYKAANYINNYGTKRILVEVAVLIPKDDPIKETLSKEFLLTEGDEKDVLSRYVKASNEFTSDYFCRITGDCPLIPHFIISKLITLAVTNEYDYVSNVDERCRTTVDGWDCEVFSRRALLYAWEFAKDPKDKEHVTTFLRHSPPSWLKQGMVINFLDLSYLKLSVDTEEDLKRVTHEFEKIDQAHERAVEIFGRYHVHRF